MLTSAIGRRTFHQAITLRARDLLLVLLVGMLAGNLIITLSGGIPLSPSRSANPEAAAYQPAHVLNLSYRLNPSNPAQIGEVRLQANTIQGDSPGSVSVRVSGSSAGWTTCAEQAGTWVCPMGGLAVADLTDLEVQAN